MGKTTDDGAATVKLRLMRESLRWRLILATACTICLALFLTGWVLQRLFHDHVTQQFAQTLEIRLNQVAARLEMDADGAPSINSDLLSDPRWRQPYSGLYWQIDQIAPADVPANQSVNLVQNGVLRSRSLWDATLILPLDALADGRAHRHIIPGPNHQTLITLERAIRMDESGGKPPWRLIVAADTARLDQAISRFSGLLALSLSILFALLMLAAFLQIHVGLAPLRHLRTALRQIQHGKAQQLLGHYPQEVQPLVEDFNQVLNRNAEIVARSRSQAGNLAHAIKTPLAVLQQAGELARQNPHTQKLARVLLEQVEIAGRQVNWHLARSRAAAAGVPGYVTPLAPTLASLIRAMKIVYAERGIEIDWTAPPPTVVFAGEIQDLQEMLGNLLDNACKWARNRVVIKTTCQSTELSIDIMDDGPGISPKVVNSVLLRGIRLDESIPGSGLGLSIVNELSTLYRGTLKLSTAPVLGGLRACLTLPAVPCDQEENLRDSDDPLCS